MSDLGTALVTGASTGIGAIYADRLARRSYDLILVARDAARLEALATRLRTETGCKVDVLVADLIDRGGVAAVETRLAADATITMLVNNAGMSLTGTLLDSSVDSVERLIALNITAVTLLAGAAGRAFAGRGKGAIVNLASVLALAPERFDGVYSGSKAFVLNLSQSLAPILEPKGVRVQAVLPGATRTEMVKMDDVLGRLSKQAGTMSDTIDKARTRTRVVTRKLKGLEQVDAVRADALLGLDEEVSAEEED